MELTIEVKDLYQNLLKELERFGGIVVEEKKTSIHLKNRAAFAGVHPRKNYFILNIVSSSPIQSSKIIKQEQVSKSRFHNEVKIETASDINKNLLTWLKEAYTLMA